MGERSKLGGNIKVKLTIEAVSNGLGAQSMYLCVLAAKRTIPCTVSVTADTGAEQDRLWSNGRRTTSRIYFDEVVSPYCRDHGIDARFVRAQDQDGNELPDLMSHVWISIAAGKPPNLPLFGSKGGRLRQVCTDKWKIRAIRQEARRMGATQLITAQGIHYGEADRRVKGTFIEDRGPWAIYQDTLKRKTGDQVIKWCRHYYPLVDLKLKRDQVAALLAAEGIPYLLSSECDHCPHKDLPRWDRTSPEKLEEIVELEKAMEGQYFFTAERVPIMQALEIMRKKKRSKADADFGCGNSYCGV